MPTVQEGARSKPYTISWPLNPVQVQHIEDEFQILFDDMRNGALIIDASQITTGILPAPRGGTGHGVYVIGDLLYASATDALSRLADIAVGNALLSGGVGASPSWGKVNLTTTITDILPIANGGTSSGTALSGSSIMIANGTQIVQGTAGTTTTVLHGNASGAPTYSAVSLTADVTGTLPAANGGTGIASYAVGDLLYASASTTLSKLADVATGNALISGGVTTAPSWGKIGLTTHVSGTLPVANGGTNSGTALSGSTIIISNGSAIVQGAAGTTTTVLHGNAGGAPTYGAVSLTADVSGTLPAANGGTGLASYAVGDLLYASASTTLATLADVATGNALISGGVTTAPSWGKIGLTTHVSGTLPIANGGTNSGTALSGSSIIISNGSAIVQGAAGTTTTVLHGNAAGAPTYSAVSLTADVTGTLPVANGGSGTATAFTLGSVIFAGASGVYSQDNTDFFWNNSLKSLYLRATNTTYQQTTLAVGGTAGAPATSGTAATGVARFYGTASNITLDIGNINSGSFPVWLQSTDVSDLSQTYALVLQPRGGNVGIGNTSPGAPLSIFVTGTGSGLANEVFIDKSQFTDDTGFYINFRGGASGTTSRGQIGLTHQGSGGDTIFVSEAANYLGLSGVNGIQFGVSTAVGMTFTTTGLGIGGVPGTKLEVFGGSVRIPNGQAYYWNESGANNGQLYYDATIGMQFVTAGTERMRIQPGGNVGIGTTGPSQLLHAKGSQPAVLVESTATSDAVFRSKTTSGEWGSGTGIGAASNIWNVYDFGAGAERMRIDSNGLVGMNSVPQDFGNGGNKLTIQQGSANNRATIGVWASASTGNGSQPAITFANGSAVAKWSLFYGVTGGEFNIYNEATGISTLIAKANNIGISATDPTIGLSLSSASRLLTVVGDATASSSATGVIIAANNRATPAVSDTAGLIGFASVNNGDGILVAEVFAALTGAGGTHGFGSDLKFFTKPDNNAAMALALSIHSNQTLTMPAYGAGAATFDASGNLTSVSDSALKTNIRPYPYGRQTLKHLSAKLYRWASWSGYDTAHDYPGFCADDVHVLMPEATIAGPGGLYSNPLIGVVCTLVNAVNEMQTLLAAQLGDPSPHP